MQGNSLHKIKMTIFVVMALALMGLSLHGALDDFAHETVVKTTNESLALFAISRGINAVVSFFQETPVPYVGLKVGELLDPLNDAIERLSGVLVWAIGSLFLQRVVLEVASSSVAKWIFLVFGFLAVTASLLGIWQRFRDLFGGWDGYRDLFVRVFVYLVVFRFIVPVFAILGFFVSHLLFDTEINKNREDLSLFSKGISVEASTPSLEDREYDEQQTLKESELAELRQRMASYVQENDALGARIEELGGGGGLSRYLAKSLGGNSPDEQRLLEAPGSPELDELHKRMASYLQEAKALDARIEEIKGDGGLRQYLPESLGGVSPEERQAFKESGLPELDEFRERMASYMEEAEALDARIKEIKGGGGLRRYLPESLGGVSPEERQAFKESGLPELDELRERMASYMEETEALDAQIQALSDEVGLRQYLPESFGGVSPGEELAAAKARWEEIRLEMENMESRVRAMEAKKLATAEARREEIRLEVENMESQVRAMEAEQLAIAETRRGEIRREMVALEEQIRIFEGEQLATAEIKREEIRREMVALEEQIRVFEGELLASAEARREEISDEMETAESQIRAVEEDLECIEKRRVGEDCVSLLGNLSAMGREGYARVRDLISKAGGVVTTIVKLTIVVIVKNILLPGQSTEYFSWRHGRGFDVLSYISIRYMFIGSNEGNPMTEGMTAKYHVFNVSSRSTEQVGSLYLVAR